MTYRDRLYCMNSAMICHFFGRIERKGRQRKGDRCLGVNEATGARGLCFFEGRRYVSADLSKFTPPLLALVDALDLG